MTIFTDPNETRVSDRLKPPHVKFAPSATLALSKPTNPEVTGLRPKRTITEAVFRGAQGATT